MRDYIASSNATMGGMATLNERRAMKKAAQPEHSYTGYIPKWMHDEESSSGGGAQKRNPPILGYSGHLRHEEDRIGTTFSKGLAVARQAEAAGAGPLTLTYREEKSNNNNNDARSPKKHVTFAEPPLVASQAKQPLSKRSGYGAFEGASGYGEFQAKPMSKQSGYGAFEGASGYGEFQAKPMSGRSGYGAFDGASGYGDFQGKPMSARSGYGAFDAASGYGDFAAPPTNRLAPGSGYGAFDGASGYGDFQSKPMSARSGYGAFDSASGYGDFAARPQMGKKPAGGTLAAGSGYGEFDNASGYGDFAGAMSARSGYGEFDNASGYGDFQARPRSPQSDGSEGYGDFDNASVEYGDFMSKRSGYGAFDKASGYGEFMAPPEAAVRTVAQVPINSDDEPVKDRPLRVKQNAVLDRQYQQALKAIGGTAAVARLLDAFAATIRQRHVKRTELLQTLKRNFEKHELQNHGQMTKAQLKEALVGLSCVFSDDQLMALMSVYDPECRGTVPMDTMITDLSQRILT